MTRFLGTIFGLTLIAMFSGAGLGCVTAVTAIGIAWPQVDTVAEAASVGSVLGAVQGLVAAPPVVVMLYRKTRARAWKMIYGPGVVAALLLGFVLGVTEGHEGVILLAWILPTVAVWAGCLAATHYCAEQPLKTPGHCVDCDYDLRGNASGVCPECGNSIERPGRAEEERQRTMQYIAIAVFISFIIQCIVCGMAVGLVV